MAEVILTLSGDELMGRRSFRRPAKRRVFIAYRMNVQASIEMRDQLGAALAARGIEVLDGNVEDFEAWPKTIRGRISDSKIVVADASGPSREVLFEMGFAGARRLFPIVERVEQRDTIPSWITSVNIPEYRGSGIERIANQVSLSLESTARGHRRPTPSPGLVSWIQNPDSEWCLEARASVARTCEEVGLHFNFCDYSVYSSEDLDGLLKSWIVFGAIDGGDQDYLSHYVLGDVAARTMAGSGRGRRQALKRHGIVMTKSGSPREQYLASGLLRVGREFLAPGTELNAASLMLGHARHFKQWLNEKPIREEYGR